MTLTVRERQQLVVDNRGLAFAVMKKLCIHRKGWAEAESEAMLALCAAASTYEPEHGAFSTWAWNKIRWALKTHMTRSNRPRHFAENGGRSTKRQTGGEEVLSFHQGFTVRSKTRPADALAVESDFEQVLGDTGEDPDADFSPNPEATTENRETLERVRLALEGAKPMTRKVGLLAFEGLTKEEIAELLGVSVSTVARRRKEARALLEPLRQALKDENNG